MIHYSLICENDHKFDGWFRNVAAYDQQQASGVVTCPVCTSGKIEKALMAPSVSRGTSEKVPVSTGHPQQEQLRAAMQALRARITSEADYVGDSFAAEARKMHFKEVDPRGIYGEATHEEVRGLLEDGIDFLPLPRMPDEHN